MYKVFHLLWTRQLPVNVGYFRLKATELGIFLFNLVDNAPRGYQTGGGEGLSTEVCDYERHLLILLGAQNFKDVLGLPEITVGTVMVSNCMANCIIALNRFSFCLKSIPKLVECLLRVGDPGFDLR